MAFGHDEERVRAERARAIGLFRYSLICEPADTRLSTRQRGRLVRAIAAREHEGPRESTSLVRFHRSRFLVDSRTLIRQQFQSG